MNLHTLRNVSANHPELRQALDVEAMRSRFYFNGVEDDLSSTDEEVSNDMDVDNDEG